MLDALLETIGTLGVLASIGVKLATCLPKAQHRNRELVNRERQLRCKARRHGS
ncbi:hypothetical protein ACN9MU_24595 [Pseudoduganella sp. R-32]|uniref:hypothetical protein n=1 Tax=Pseudoduganella sp. R-32 TaxID=3404061 RepID=UPI003CF6C71C